MGLNARRMIAAISIFLTIAGVSLLVVGRRPTLGTAALVAGVLIPFGFFILHLNLSREHTDEERAYWRSRSWLGWGLATTVWTYLLTTNVKSETIHRDAGFP